MTIYTSMGYYAYYIFLSGIIYTHGRLVYHHNHQIAQTQEPILAENGGEEKYKLELSYFYFFNISAKYLPKSECM